jgi:hypothetical protein
MLREGSDEGTQVGFEVNESNQPRSAAADPRQGQQEQ